MAMLCMTPTRADLAALDRTDSHPAGTGGSAQSVTMWNTPSDLGTNSAYPTAAELQQALMQMEMKEFLETMRLQNQRCKGTRIVRVNEPDRYFARCEVCDNGRFDVHYEPATLTVHAVRCASQCCADLTGAGYVDVPSGFVRPTYRVAKAEPQDEPPLATTAKHTGQPTRATKTPKPTQATHVTKPTRTTRQSKLAWTTGDKQDGRDGQGDRTGHQAEGSSSPARRPSGQRTPKLDTEDRPRRKRGRPPGSKNKNGTKKSRALAQRALEERQALEAMERLSGVG